MARTSVVVMPRLGRPRVVENSEFDEQAEVVGTDSLTTALSSSKRMMSTTQFSTANPAGGPTQMSARVGPRASSP